MIKQKWYNISDKALQQTTSEQAKDIWTWKLDYKKHLEEIYEKDPSLKKEIDELNKEKKEFEDQNKKNEDIDKSLKIETESKQTNIETGSYKYDTNSWVVEITLDNWNQKLELSPTEKELAKNNPEAIKNIVDFYSTLNKVWLAKLWPIKEQIFNVISSIKWVWFKIDQNYLSENETKIFLNAILKSTWEETINPILGINDFVANIERKNNTQFSWAEAQVNKSWDTKIEQKFISSFAPRWNLLWFDSPAFEQKIRS